MAGGRAPPACPSDTGAGPIRTWRAGTAQCGRAAPPAGRGLVYGPPKSRAGLRSVAIPEAIRADLLAHLDEFTDSAPDAWVFTGQRGNPLRRGDFNPRTGWKKAVADIGVPHLHFHDLRHTGNTLAARTKASTRDLMARMGHDSPRAALIYQHATTEASREIAAALSGLVERERGGGGDEDDGSAGVLVPVD
ncbi:tyrosine-type recombinase/integrase [Actinosynnema sp. NPDC050801]|uniref:tyrosine-type recombinase/integrase n=1 Tax=unclassified Actinosynnema TaxID=2637065 RepID=UPI0033C4D75D